MKRILLFVTLISCLVSKQQLIAQTISLADSLALVELHNANPNSKLNINIDSVNGWDLSKPVLSWDGISLNSLGRLELRFSRKNLDTITPSIGEIPNVQFMTFQSNNISYVPSNLTKSKTLDNLILDFNNISIVPPELLYYSSKVRMAINLNSNQISSLPSPHISEVHTGPAISINKNPFAGTFNINNGLNCLNSISILQNNIDKINIDNTTPCYDSRFGGSTPYVGNPEGMYLRGNSDTIIISHNLSQGAIDSMWFSKDSTQYLVFNSTIPLPFTIDAADSLILVDLYNANSTSKLHKSVDPINGWDLTTQVRYWSGIFIDKEGVRLNLSNKLLDSISPSLGGFKNLYRLNFSSNNISIIPRELGNLRLIGLSSIIFSQNKIKSIPIELQNIQFDNFNYLGLDRNLITQFPDEISTMPISAIDISENPLQRIKVYDNNCIKNYTLIQTQISRIEMALSRPICTGRDDEFTIDVSGSGDTLLVCGNVNQAFVDSFDFNTNPDVIKAYVPNCEFTDSIEYVSGKVYEDLNNNSVCDKGEEVIGIKVEIEGISSTYSNQNGDYTLIGTKGASNIIKVGDLTRLVCNGKSQVLITAVNNNIAIQLDSAVSDVNFKVVQPDPPCVSVCGKIWTDKNKNGKQDKTDINISNVLLELNGTEYVPVNPDGTFCFDYTKGENFVLKPIGYKFHYNCGKNPFEVTFPAEGEYSNAASADLNNLDFGIHTAVGNSQYSVGAVSLRMGKGTKPGKEFRAWMDYKIRDSLPNDCKLKVKHDPFVKYINSSVPVDVKSNSGFEWNRSSETLRRGRCMGFKFNLSKDVPLNYELKWDAEFTCKDNCPQDDKISRSFKTRSNSNSNFKVSAEKVNYQEVYHGDKHNLGKITVNDSVFSYVINFQNTTGHTVYNMQIIDTLSEFLDVKTISSPFSTLPYKLFINNKNILRIEYNNISLPDSSENELDSYGFVQFNIKMKPNLQAGTEIVNQAGIVFNHDYTNSRSLKKVTNIIEPSSENNCFSGAISGVLKTGTSAITSGEVSLYTTGGVLKEKYEVKDGVFSFSNVLIGGYILKAEGAFEQENLIPVYNSNVISYGSNIQTINVSCNSNTHIEFNLAKQIQLNGTGVIQGKVGEGLQPKKGVTIYLALKNNPTNILRYTLTNELGEYKFLSLPLSLEYVIIVDLVGNNSTNQQVSFINSNLVQEINFCINANAIGYCDKAVGVNDLLKTANFSIYPNPSSGIFTINTDEKNYTVEIYNSIGQLLFTIENVTEIDLTTYPNGLYNIKVNDTSKIVVKQ